MKTYRYHIEELNKNLVFSMEKDILISLSLDEATTLPVEQDPVGDFVFQQVEAYFCGERQVFEIKYDLSSLTAFQQSVLQALTSIRYGQVTTYKDLAKLANHPRAYRAVGSVMAMNPIPLIIPCHRVVRSDGYIGAYSMGGPDFKSWLLELEKRHA